MTHTAESDVCPGCGHAPHMVGWCIEQMSPACDCNVDDGCDLPPEGAAHD